LGKAESSGVVEADTEDLFHFTDWCYNDPEWAPSIRRAWIKKLSDASGLGKVSHYVGTLMGRDAEWEGELVEWKPKEFWAMQAINGPPARMKMKNQMRFKDLGHGRTEVTCTISYRIPYPVVGPLLDLYLRGKAKRHTNNAIQGMKMLGAQHRIPPLNSQMEKRKKDHPGYQPPNT
jgi:uncharacterized membrane protein